MSGRPDGHYWVQWGTSNTWDVFYWEDGFFWDHGDAGYAEEHFIIGPQIFPPASDAPETPQ